MLEDQELDKKEQKQENKKTAKAVVISVACTLLFVIIILLLVILGLKNCSNIHGDHGSNSSEPSGQAYDSAKLDNVFKKIVSKQMVVDGLGTDELGDVLAVTYTDSNHSFDLDISVKGASKVYYYHLDNSTYTGYDNFVSYILNTDFDNKAGRPLDGVDAKVTFLSLSSDSLTTDKVCKYAITENDLGTIKFLSGFYYENNQYNVYLSKEITGSNPFSSSADQVINSGDILYSYYSSLISA